MRIKSKTGYAIVIYGATLFVSVSCIYTTVMFVKWVIEKLF